MTPEQKMKREIPIEEHEILVCRKCIGKAIETSPLGLLAMELHNQFQQRDPKNPKKSIPLPCLTAQEAVVVVRCIGVGSKDSPFLAVALNIGSKIQQVFKTPDPEISAKKPVKKKRRDTLKRKK